MKTDALTRWLRSLAAITFLVFIGFLVFDPFNRGRDLSILLLLIGAEALWLGYEVVLPFIQKKNGDGHD